MRTRLGFSVMEIAIVLVIIGLIAGGVVAARSMIRTSQLQGVMTEYQMYNAAIKNFQAKYRALPGDFSTATTPWGARTTCPVDATADAGTATCNGDGDGIIEFDGTPTYEHILAWRHLGLSGFINQNYTGNTASGTISCAIDIKSGDNVPNSKLSGVAWNLGASTLGTAYTTGAAGTQYFPMDAARDLPTMHALWLGGSLQDDNAQAASCALSQIPVMTGMEAYEIDAKYDDNVATSGKIRSQYNNTATYQTCENLASTNGAYRTDATGINCALAFLIEP